MTSRDQDTIPAPEDHQAKLTQQLQELELAMARVGECMNSVSLSVHMIKLATATTEARTHVIHEAKRNDRRWLVDLEKRMRVLEGLGEPTAAE